MIDLHTYKEIINSANSLTDEKEIVSAVQDLFHMSYNCGVRAIHDAAKLLMLIGLYADLSDKETGEIERLKESFAFITDDFDECFGFDLLIAVNLKYQDAVEDIDLEHYEVLELLINLLEEYFN